MAPFLNSVLQNNDRLGDTSFFFSLMFSLFGKNASRISSSAFSVAIRNVGGQRSVVKCEKFLCSFFFSDSVKKKGSWETCSNC
jgi:hypothetical protein